jgi:2-keto-4-pentenoate hydratase/2-oxohepta-3-ene-1,7-dioic acid hydratase in catechol pathway
MFTLEPGDLILTGTPPGVGEGMDPKTYLKDGDVVSVTISGIGTLTNPCRVVEG